MNSARQQYVPTALSFGDVPPLTSAEVAWPFASKVAAEPTCVPFAEQSPPFAVTSAGEQRKKSTEPTPGAWGVPTVTSSCCVAPIEFSEPPGVAVVSIGGGAQVEPGATLRGAM